MRSAVNVSERKACKVLKQPRSSQRYESVPSEEGKALTEDIIALASLYGRYGYRRITALLRRNGWQVNHKKVERIWRREGLKVPQKQPKRGRLWLNDSSCIRLRPTRHNHVWAYDFVLTRPHNGKAVRMLTVINPPRRTTQLPWLQATCSRDDLGQLSQSRPCQTNMTTGT